MKVFIGCDHRGVKEQEEIKDYLESLGHEVYISGVPHNDTDDYPDFAFDVCSKVLDNNSFGILLCGTGIGMSIAANKVKGIRAARCVNETDAYYARIHNNANVLCLGINDTDITKLFAIAQTFLKKYPEPEERHKKRIEKIIKYEDG